MKDIASAYFAAFQKACAKRKITALRCVHGASEEDIHLLRQKYPKVPGNLVTLLSLIDGTYHRQYGEHRISLPIFAGEKVPYYLDSAQQMLREWKFAASIANIYGPTDSYADPDDKERDNAPSGPERRAALREYAAEGIDPFQLFSQMLHVSDCINEGGTSSLYIDFHPAEGGVAGQIVRFTHDPDYYDVIAPSFDAFLEQCLERGFDFLEEEEEIVENPALTFLLQRLRSGDSHALKALTANPQNALIARVANEIRTPDVLRIYLGRMEELYRIRDQKTPQGYSYEPQFTMLLRAFEKLSDVYMNDEKLKEDVAAFARTVQAESLIRQLSLKLTTSETKELFRDKCSFAYVQERYRALGQAQFYEEAELAWQQESFDEYFSVVFRSFAPYVPGTRSRICNLDRRWKERLLAQPQPRPIHITMLADLAESEADINALQALFIDPGASSHVHLLAWFTHALCLAGEDMLEARLPWVYEQVLSTLQANKAYLGYRFNNDPLSLEYAVQDFKNPSPPFWQDFTFIVAVRPLQSLELLAKIEALLTNPKAQKLAARLARLLKKKA